MPIPAPSKDESKDAFISRCMGDSVMKREFPDNKQRVAVCMSKWIKKGKKSKSSMEELSQEERDFLSGFLERHPQYKPYFEEVNNANG